MTSFPVPTPSEFRVNHGVLPKQRAPAAAADVTLHIQRPSSTSVVVRVVGELDSNSAPRLHELLAPRLNTVVSTLILDFSALRFLGVAGVELLEHVRRRASSKGIALRLVDGPVCVSRALRAAGCDGVVSTCSSVELAIVDAARPRRSAPEKEGRSSSSGNR